MRKGLDHIRNGATAETQYLLSIIDEQEQQLGEARALLEEAEAVIDSHWGDQTAMHRSPHVVLNRLRAFLQKLSG